MNAGESTAAKGMKGVRRDKRDDDGGEKRGRGTEAGKRDAGEGILPFCYVH